MTYEEFTELLKSRLMSELSYTPDDMTFYPFGYTANDPENLSMILSTNQRFSTQYSKFLLEDILEVRYKRPNYHEFIIRINAEDLYEKSEANGFEAEFARIRDIHNSMVKPIIAPEIFSKLNSAGYDEMKDSLIIRLRNYRRHRNYMEGCVYKRRADMVFVLYYQMRDSNGKLETDEIKRDVLKRWGMSGRKDEVMRAALENTARLYPARAYNFRADESGNLLSAKIQRKNKERPHMIILATTSDSNGAIALFYPGVAEKIREIMGGGFQAVLINISDAVIFGHDDPYAREYLRTFRNRTSWEKLSSKIFVCDENGLRHA